MNIDCRTIRNHWSHKSDINPTIRRLQRLALAFGLISVTAAATSCGPLASTPPNFSAPKEAWDANNDPLRLYGNYERALQELPITGALTTTPWSDTYWPSYKGGVANRWNDPSSDAFEFTPPDRDTAAAMSLYERSLLSPAEKFDLATQRYHHPFVAAERRRTKPDNPSWYGLCHGWAAAAIHFEEPHATLITNADGLEIPFGASDVKALLTYYQGQVAQTTFKSLGSRCNQDIAEDPTRASDPECRDVNAGSFHVALTNQIGTLQQSFVAEVSRDYQIWNQPVFGFATKVLSYQDPTAGAAPGTVKEANIETQMAYGVETFPAWDAFGPTGQATTTRTYRYRVELNAAGQIIGGEWDGGDRPDFLWVQSKPQFGGYFAALDHIFKAATSGEPLARPRP